MTSERKIAAARANGAKSRGPKTEAGRRRSSQNSRKHGLYARTPPDTSDIPAELLQSFAGHWALFQPKTPRAVAALEASIEAKLQLFRLQRTETAMMNVEYIRLRALFPGLDRDALYYRAKAKGRLHPDSESSSQRRFGPLLPPNGPRRPDSLPRNLASEGGADGLAVCQRTRYRRTNQPAPTRPAPRPPARAQNRDY